MRLTLLVHTIIIIIVTIIVIVVVVVVVIIVIIATTIIAIIMITQACNGQGDVSSEAIEAFQCVSTGERLVDFNFITNHQIASTII